MVHLVKLVKDKTRTSLWDPQTGEERLGRGLGWWVASLIRNSDSSNSLANILASMACFPSKYDMATKS